jgi:hypothetical protein
MMYTLWSWLLMAVGVEPDAGTEPSPPGPPPK